MVDVLIQSFNEEKNLSHTLGSLAGWPGRIFVVDSGSTDRTTEIAREMGATVVHRDWEGYARQKNWALDNLPFAADWILILDADEAVSAELREEILALASRPPETVKEAGFLINRVFVFMGRRIWHCGYFPSWNLRLFKRGRARYEDRSVHEHMLCEGRVGKLKHLLIHEDRRGLEHFFAKHNRYSSLEARELFDNPEPWPGFAELAGNPLKRRRFLKSRVLTRLPLVWLWRFLYMYILRGGFLDGRAGWLLSNFISAYEFSIRIKYRELQLRGGELAHEPEGLAQPEGSLTSDFAPRPMGLALERMSGRRSRARSTGRAVFSENVAARRIGVVVLHAGSVEQKDNPLPEWVRGVQVRHARMALAPADSPGGEVHDPSEVRGIGGPLYVDSAVARELDGALPWTLFLAAGDVLDANAWQEVMAFTDTVEPDGAALLLRRKVCRHGRCINSGRATLAAPAILLRSPAVREGARVGRTVRSRSRISHRWDDSIEKILSRELWHARRLAQQHASALKAARGGTPAIPREARWTSIMLAPAGQFLRLMLVEGAVLGGRAAWSAAFIAASVGFVRRLLLREQIDVRFAPAERSEPSSEPAAEGSRRAKRREAALAS